MIMKLLKLFFLIIPLSLLFTACGLLHLLELDSGGQAVMNPSEEEMATGGEANEFVTPVTSTFPTSVMTETTYIETVSAAEEQVYYNENFGFRLTLPETWTGYEATQNGRSDQSAICFSFPEHSHICVLQIDVFTKEAWNALVKTPPNYYLAENEQYVFAAEPGSSTECVQLDAFQCARYQEIPGILSSFTLTGE